MKLYVTVLLFVVSFFSFSQNLPKGFVYLEDVESSIKTDLKYYTNDNFVGKPIEGYTNNCVILTKETAEALKKIQSIVLKKGLSLKIYDAYRPQRAVNNFVSWAKLEEDTIKKQSHYPKVNKKDVFKLGYVATKSGHSRGSTVDLTLVDNVTGKELDMGSSYDFFGEISHVFYPSLSKQQKENRNYLRKVMLENGFKPYSKEWWHFTLQNEPFPNTYFNFPIK